MESSQLPRYVYDPVTQSYKLMTPQEEAQRKRKQSLGALYDAGGGDGVASGDTGVGHGGSAGGLGSLGLAGMNYADATFGLAPGAAIANAVGQSLADAAIAQNAAADASIAQANAQGVTVSSNTGAFGPTTTTHGLAGLAAMNADSAESDDGPVGAVGVGPAISDTATAAQQAAAMDAATADAQAGLAAANAAQAAESESDSQAAAVADTAAAVAEGVAEGTATGMGDDGGAAAAAGGSDGGGGGGGDGAGGDGSGPGGDGSDGGGDGSGGGGGDGEREGGIIRMKRYQQGGVADAYKTQARGRGPDTMLVHMSPREVQGLQALAMAHGGSLTINPKTGLPEAGFLDSILPMVAGAALTIGSGGTLTPLMAAGIVGGGTALMTGDLGKGFMAGLGAFGGAGLGAGLSAAGASATAPTVTGTVPGLTQSGAAGASQALQAAQAVAPEAISATGAASTTVGGVPYYAIPTETGMVMAPQAAGGAAPMFDIAGSVGSTGAQAPMSIADRFMQAGRGVSNIFDFSSPAGEQARTAFIGQAEQKDKAGNVIQKATGLGGGLGALKTAGTVAAPLLAGGLGGEEEDGLKKQQTYIRPYKFDAGRKTEEEGFKYRTGAPGDSTSELTYFTPSFTPQGVYKYEDYMAQNMATGGIASMAKGRYLKGAGDGMSDDIPATIEGGQPARLADGEFVVPADVVSHLGNGSSNAGAKKLYKMMDRVRQARTGKKRQAPEVRTDRYMPA